MIEKNFLQAELQFCQPYNYEGVLVHPIKMKNCLDLLSLQDSIIINKNGLFSQKNIIKMTYLDFLRYAMEHPELEEQYNVPGLAFAYLKAIKLLSMTCKDSSVEVGESNELLIDDRTITPEMFDDLRRIIILQNDIDFDIDEFLNYDTIKRLEKAKSDLDKSQDKATIEDYIDSLIVATGWELEKVLELPVRKFWRFVKRLNLRDTYKILKTAECSGMVSFKEPVRHWMGPLDSGESKYDELKADSKSVTDKLRE